RISGSVGISIYNADNQVLLERLYEQADIALYQAKRAGKNCAVFFSSPR
ncbi:MAG: GGDEF domain-containing protein, partial [Pseudomonas sp.]|nr:GGDEF domain-containing protein [Pseudomonas sp.]